MNTTFVHWFASTGAFHRNGRTLVAKSLDPRTAEERAHRDARVFAIEVGRPLKTFSVQLNGCQIHTDGKAIAHD